jgi:hypothetical protein
MCNLQELHISTRLGHAFYYGEDIPVRRLFLSLMRAEHKTFAAPLFATMPAQVLDIVVRNTHLGELLITYFCASGCTTSCADDENIKGWIIRASAPSRPRIHYRRVWTMIPDDEEGPLSNYTYMKQHWLSWEEEHM